MIVLGIETSCDETSIALVENGKKILSLQTASSIDLHQKFGGVFPEIACRRHIEVLSELVQTTYQAANLPLDATDLIAVTQGPGLIGALLIGLEFAKGLSLSLEKPLIGINHIEAHLYAALMNPLSNEQLPALGFVLSGGHTLMLKIHSLGVYEKLGTTVDDAIGEAFDKVASLLGMPYPGGPHIEALAKTGNPLQYPFQGGKVKQNPLFFSFSGLKTAVLYALKGQNGTQAAHPEKQQRHDIAASFQKAAISDLIEKAKKALVTFPCQSIVFGGGVCSNQALREAFQAHFPHLPLFWPSPELCVDNGAMIAGLGYQKFLQHPPSNPMQLRAKPRIPIA